MLFYFLLQEYFQRRATFFCDSYDRRKPLPVLICRVFALNEYFRTKAMNFPIFWECHNQLGIYYGEIAARENAAGVIRSCD
jgi:hypothetical protein